MRKDTKSILPALVLILAGCASNNGSDSQIQKKESYITTLPSEALEQYSPAVPVATRASKTTISAHHNYEDTETFSNSGLSVKTERLKTLRSSQHHRLAEGDISVVQPNYEHNREVYAELEHAGVKQVAKDPVSTFSIDVDTGAYTNLRRMLVQGVMPPENAVRIEEMINYFNYDYPSVSGSDSPFSINTEIARSPWSKDHALLKIGLKGYKPAHLERPPANLVFLLDVSGSMNSSNKLPLLKKSLTMLIKQLDYTDKVSIVVYAGASGVVLEPTSGADIRAIEQALSNLSAGGSTNGQAGIQLAYDLAAKNYNKDGINRVILATDGDFNVGISDVERLKTLIAKKRSEGVSLTTLGFGAGNYNDHLIEQLANVGNGNYAYIDSLHAAQKVLVEELDATLMTIAKDVKIQVEFNPSAVKEYRLLGYENRALNTQDFKNDKVDAGDAGVGSTVTALYEIVLFNSDYNTVDPLRYQSTELLDTQPISSKLDEMAFVKLRYKPLNKNKSHQISLPIPMPQNIMPFEQASVDFRFSSTVAEFGEVLRQSKYVDSDFDTIIEQAMSSRGTDPFGYRSEFIQLVRLASVLAN